MNPTFKAVAELLQVGHQKDNHSPTETLNRLFLKHLERYPDLRDVAPKLTPENTTVKLDSYSAEHLNELSPKPGPAEPRFTDVPVVVILYRGKECLIDGNNRVRYWRKSGDTQSKDVYVVSVIDAD